MARSYSRMLRRFRLRTYFVWNNGAIGRRSFIIIRNKIAKKLSICFTISLSLKLLLHHLTILHLAMSFLLSNNSFLASLQTGIVSIGVMLTFDITQNLFSFLLAHLVSIDFILSLGNANVTRRLIDILTGLQNNRITIALSLSLSFGTLLSSMFS